MNDVICDISVVVPIYKEEKNIKPFVERTVKVLQNLNITYEVLFCLDPSPDATQAAVELEIAANKNIKLLIFSRRFGQPAATMAGILNATGKAVVVIDVDLQDQPELIAAMYAKLQQGFEVVYAKRRSRRGETLIKKIIAHIGYSVINKLSDVQIPRNTGDFRIMTRKVVEELRKINESHGFLRGLVAYVGYKQTFIEYDRDERHSGRGNYNRLTGSLKIGLNGLISFSSKPLFMMSMLGFSLSFVSFCIGLWYVAQKLMGFNLTPGLSTTVLIVTFFAGVQLLGLGLIGEYVGRIYDEVKRRPMFIIEEKINM